MASCNAAILAGCVVGILPTCVTLGKPTHSNVPAPRFHWNATVG